jgi:hypothetical protein
VTAPLFDRPPDLERPAVIKVWLFDEPPTMVDQVVAASLTNAAAAFLTTEVEAELQRRWVSKGKAVRYVHDWRHCTSYASAARDRLIDWGKASMAHSAHVAVCISDKSSPFVRIAAVTGVGVLRMLKMSIELVSDLEPLLAPLRSRR